MPNPTHQPKARQQHDEISGKIRDSASLGWPYLIMNALAAVIACYGMLENSTAVIIGAMIVATLLGPITGFALGLTSGDWRLLRGAALAEAAGIALVLAISYSIGWVHHDISLGSQVISRTTPNILDLVIALAGGTAGAYANISPKVSVGLVGVAIATALVPPLCASGLCLAHGLYHEAGGAALLFLTNLVAIESVSALVLWAGGFAGVAGRQSSMILSRFIPSLLLLVGLAVVLFKSFQATIAAETLHSDAQKVLDARFTHDAASLVDISVSSESSGRALLVAVARAPYVITPASCADLQAAIRKRTRRSDVDLRIRTVLTREASPTGYVKTSAADAQSLKGGGGGE